jgi:hypothetical protein
MQKDTIAIHAGYDKKSGNEFNFIRIVETVNYLILIAFWAMRIKVISF